LVTTGAWDDCEVRIARSLWEEVQRQVLGDGNEGTLPGAGVLFCGIARSGRGVRLLGREFVRAVDGVDYVDSTVGHGALTTGFTLDAALRAETSGLVPLFVHGHAGSETVGFSETDLRSHERGYPALVANASGPVGALVVASRAIDLDLFIPGGSRVRTKRAVVVGPSMERLGPRDEHPGRAAAAADRHARLFGAAGLRVLASSKVAVVGAGGVGLLAIQWLSMLGVGELVVIDPGRVKKENRSRLPGATRRDARGGDRISRLPEWLALSLGLVGMPKVRLAARLARKASMGTMVTMVRTVVSDPAALRHLTGCDFILLAADSDAARYAANRIAHQYLVPVVQAGSKVQVDRKGDVIDVFAVVRPVLPDQGCLRCAGTYSGAGLSYEAHFGVDGRRHDYGTGEPAPSVAALNAIAASIASSFVQFWLTEMRTADGSDNVFVHPLDDVIEVGVSYRDPACETCSAIGIVGWGDLKTLRIPTVEGARHPPAEEKR
jgi:hypothetical protein